MLRIRKKGQSSLEYAVLIIIVLGAFLAIGNYFKRAIQGRWKASVDDLGDQYDPRFTNGSIIQRLNLNTLTQLRTLNIATGFFTYRTDETNSIETKSGYTAVGAY